jgi:hypothetical protein
MRTFAAIGEVRKRRRTIPTLTDIQPGYNSYRPGSARSSPGLDSIWSFGL